MRTSSPTQLARINAARDAFWTERPLVQRYRIATQANSFSLRQLIAFAKAMPADEFARCLEVM